MKLSNKQAAYTAGISLLVMAIAAGYAVGYVNSALFMDNDPAGTYQNIRNELPLFRSGLVAWIIIFLTDLLVAWALYQYFKPVNSRLSAGTAWVRFIYAGILAAGLFHLFTIDGLVAKPQAVGIEEMGKQMLEARNQFEQLWSFGLILFGIHLLGLGSLCLQAKKVPGIFGWLLLIAGVSYLFIHTAKQLGAGSDSFIATLEMVLGLPMALGELGFALWLLLRGARTRYPD